MRFENICDFEGVPYQRSLHAILLVGDEMKILDANQPALDLLGYDLPGLRAITALELAPATSRDGAQSLWRSFIAHGEQIGDYELETSCGLPLRVHYHAVADVAPGVNVIELSHLGPGEERTPAWPPAWSIGASAG